MVYFDQIPSGYDFDQLETAAPSGLLKTNGSSVNRAAATWLVAFCWMIGTSIVTCRDSSRDQGKGTYEYGDQGALHAVSTGKAVKSHGDFSG